MDAFIKNTTIRSTKSGNVYRVLTDSSEFAQAEDITFGLSEFTFLGHPEHFVEVER